ncbi:MAG: Rpn family recombination-promoting nuclease/putative transposase [Leptolyngbyaceae cyanobacterium SU_3_3]|nr:Rpn family recombination-promoting nuclease/putative transposase [Leptolyngbyaceae cyanobacterium SU_3_3]
MPFDNLCKLLSEKHPDRFAYWILGDAPPSIQVLKTELSIEPIRADSVTFLHLQGRILHLEFQTTLCSTPPLPLRMLDYWVRLHRLYRLPITQVVVLLLPPTDDTPIATAFALESTRHEYRVIPMWEQDPNLFLNDPALLPLAPLASPTASDPLLQSVAQRVRELEPTQRQEVSSYVQNFWLG